MSSKGFLRAGFCAFSLSVSLVAGCASPVVPTPATGGEVPAPAAQAPTEGTPAGQPAPTAPAPAAVTPVTLSGNASFRGEALSGYDVTVLDAQTGKAVERKADLAGVTTLAVLDKNLKTDASGAFSFQVVGLKPGQALRVQIRQGNGLLETIVTSDLQALGAKKMQLLQANAGAGLSINELTTAIAKIARGVLTTTQVLTPEAAAPVLAQLAAEMATLSVKLDAALKSNPNLANNLVSTQSKESESVNSLVSTAGALKEVTQAVAKLVSQVAKSSATNAAPAASDPAVKAQLATVQFIGTVLTGSFANNNFSLSNSATGQKVDAATGDVGSVSSNVSGSTGSGSSSSGSTTPAVVPDVLVSTGAELQAAVSASANANKIIGLSGNITDLTAPLKLTQAVTVYGAGYSLNQPVWVAASGATLKSIAVTPADFSGNGIIGVYVDHSTTLDGVTVNGVTDTRGVLTLADANIALTVKNSTFKNCLTGVFCNPGTTLTATGNTFTTNIVGIGSDSSDLTGTVSGNTFTGSVIEDIGLGTPVLTGTYPKALKAKLSAANGNALVKYYMTTIANSADLQTAINSASGPVTLTLAETYSADAPVVVNKVVTIEGNGATSAKGFEFATGSAGSSLSNLTINGQGYLDASSTDSAINLSTANVTTPVTLKNLTINYSAPSGTMLNSVSAIGSYVVIENSNFTTANTTLGQRSTGIYTTYGKVKLTSTTLNGTRGIVVYSDLNGATSATVEAISGNTFNTTAFGVYLYGATSKRSGDADATATKAHLLSGNQFGSALTTDDLRVQVTN